METAQQPTKPLHWLGETLDEATDGDALANAANFSRSHFQRRFRQLTGEMPSDCRRWLLLERAAHQLSRTVRSITDLAFDAGCDSLEGFPAPFAKPLASRRPTTNVRPPSVGCCRLQATFINLSICLPCNGLASTISATATPVNGRKLRQVDNRNSAPIGLPA